MLRPGRQSDATEDAENSAEASESGQAESTEPRNPFAALRAVREANAAADSPPDPNSVRIQLRRIAPEDVPDGMRVVSTPFGDRLVPDNQ